ncbi:MULTISPECIES: MFS transporter [Actinosynnema]|uniref:MFS transporter n=1 Tax=Actinosynnema TaxID=40566 RepID=UPI0020A5ABE0|nr:MFS transporter [Actinosynnema pretiosum]MCP2094932.1 putative arabinose efflux permease, MFS family [Actinosynnema pretiosum]
MPLAVHVLGLGVFALVTSELQVAGMMPEMARGLEVSVPDIGYLISLYALAMAVGGPILTAALLKLPKRTALMVLFGVFVAGEALAALAADYWLVLVARLITGAVSGAFFGVAIAIAVEISRPEMTGRAVSVVLSGLMAGTVLGLPVASWVGPEFGWRASFWGVAVLALVVGVITAGAVPKLEGDGATSVRGEFAVFKNWALWAVYSTSTLVIGATYAAFSYFTPILSEVTGFSGGQVTGLLVAYGIATIVGNTAVGRLADRHAIPTIAFGLVSLTVLLSVFALLTENKPVVVAVLLGVGLVGVTMNPALVARVMGVANGRSLVNTVHTSCITFGVVIGSWVGGLGIDAGLGLRAPLWIGAVMALVGLATLLPDLVRRGASASTSERAGEPKAT